MEAGVPRSDYEEGGARLLDVNFDFHIHALTMPPYARMQPPYTSLTILSQASRKNVRELPVVQRMKRTSILDPPGKYPPRNLRRNLSSQHCSAEAATSAAASRDR